MIHLQETPHSFWSDDSWVAYQALFQFTRVNTPGEMTDISWYTKYLIDGEANEVDLDELVRENERIRMRLSLLTGVEVRRIRWKRHWRHRRTTDSSSQSSAKKKREYRPLVRNLRTNKLNQFLKPPGKPTQNAPQSSSETLNGFEARLTTGENFEARPPPIVKHILRPISLRHVHSDDVASRSSGPTSHSHFDEKTVVRYIREHSREEEEVNKDWHHHHHNDSAETEGDDEALKSPVAVSDLVSKFESVRRRNAFSYGSRTTTTKNFDPYSSLERKKSSQEENQRRSIRVILHNSPPLDQMDSRIDAVSNQSFANTTHEVYKIPQRSSVAKKSDVPLLRMKSEGHSRVYPAKLGGINTTDQFSRSPSEPKPLQKGYSFDSGFRIQHPVTVHHNSPPPTIFTNDHLTSSPVGATTTTTHSNNHISVVTKLPAIRVDATNIRRTHSASKGDEPPFHNISSRSSFNKKPDAARQITYSVIPETDPVPSWKSEVEVRKRTKSYVSSHKPEQPMQLGSIPEWKKLLLEKNKQKRNSSEIHHDLSNNRVTKPDTNINYTEPAWKLEFDKIKRQVATLQSNHYAANVFDREIPEWVKLAEQRRQSKPFSDNEEA